VGRRRIDWTAAKISYVSDPTRSFGKIARQFGVSDTAVRKHANAEGWEPEAVEFDRRAEERALSAAALSRDEMTQRVLKLRDLTLERAIAQLEEGDEVKLADVPNIVKLSELLLGEATERIDPVQVKQILAIVLRLVPADRLAEFDRAVAGVLGATAELGSGS